MNSSDRAARSTVESMLSRAFTPVDPPQHLYARVEIRLEKVTFAAAEELSAWELAAMRDPRNWVTPAVAGAAGTGAGAALLVMHVRRRKRLPESNEALEALGSAFGAAARELARPGRRKGDETGDETGDTEPGRD